MKMKRLIYSVLALAAMAFAFPSCNDDAPEEVQVTFTASLAQNANSRTLSDGSKISKVKCEVYEGDIKRTEDIVDFKNGSAKYTPTLLKGRTYNAYFFAYTEGSYNVDDLQEVTRKKNISNDEAMDAFSGSKTISTTDMGESLNVTLTRPLAQLNFATTADDIKNARKLLSANGLTDEEPDMTLCTSSVKIATMSTSYNVLEGKSNDATASEQVLSEASIPTEAEKIKVNDVEYTVLATTYLFPGETTTCYLNVYAASEEETDKTLVNQTNWILTYSNVPLLDNTRTNIIGQLLTGNVPYTITLSTGFTGTVDSDANGNFPNPNE